MEPRIRSTERRPGESFYDWTDRVRAAARDVALERGEEVTLPPPVAPTHTPSAAPAPPQPSPQPRAEVSPPPLSPSALGNIGRGIGDIAGRVVEVVNRRIGRRFTPKMRDADVETPPGRVIRPPQNLVEDMVADFKRKRVPGVDISVIYFRAIVEKAIHKLAKDGRGFFQRSFKAMATLAEMGRETVRKGVAWMRDNGWLGVLNALYRDDPDNDPDIDPTEARRDKHEANVYIPFGKAIADEIAATSPDLRAKKWEAMTLARGAVIFGLFVRDGGLNKSPARRHPAPA